MADFRPLHILGHNGWEWLPYEKDMLSITTDYDQYKAVFLGGVYSSTVVAIVSTYRKHLELDGHYGVLWLEAVYENERDGCYSIDDMEDMIQAIINAEENLLTIGMPFTKDYRFHGKNIANKYVVYCFKKGESINIEDPSHIVAITPNTWYNLPYVNGKEKFVYVVTALDRMSNESAHVKKNVKL